MQRPVAGRRRDIRRGHVDGDRRIAEAAEVQRFDVLNVSIQSDGHRQIAFGRFDHQTVVAVATIDRDYPIFGIDHVVMVRRDQFLETGIVGRTARRPDRSGVQGQCFDTDSRTAEGQRLSGAQPFQGQGVRSAAARCVLQQIGQGEGIVAAAAFDGFHVGEGRTGGIARGNTGQERERPAARRFHLVDRKGCEADRVGPGVAVHIHARRVDIDNVVAVAQTDMFDPGDRIVIDDAGGSVDDRTGAQQPVHLHGQVGRQGSGDGIIGQGVRPVLAVIEIVAIAGTADDRVIAGARPDRVVARPGLDGVVPAAGPDRHIGR